MELSQMTIETAIVVLMPETEALVGPFRSLYDPAAKAGMAAHVTVVYPFAPPSALTPDRLQILAGLFSVVPAFQVAFAETRRWPDVLYLDPEPAQPFKDLVALVTRHFPQYPPYGGTFAQVIPHLTIAQMDDQRRLAGIETEFQRAAAGQLPIQTTVRSVTMMDNISGRWQARTHFDLALTLT
jgi:hypothetical protein